ncbi:type II toxin-antitoxin system CcdA family antitoxin [Mangrovicoccus algicola]|uniref:Type II toxin-antitoxin system CcdA family antitoxin n=1 Tax=Mangrovicoccus algicola TaxID=2771008 RepID=A0A8J7CG75_9RHOB|nr:type II toxin-antitoxin system CcdA family antitoxin [Mangrovicoccus algicola]MBE3636855.1 type II toxin-antitoxin system CcdA family antitoxin [Mangrovicoccus algicola]
MTRTLRKSTSMTLDRGVLEEARALGINLSQAAEAGLRAAIRTERARHWQAQNAGAVADFNAMIEDGGVPLSEFRKF